MPPTAGSSNSAEVAIVSFRFGHTDGVSVEARKWAWALGQLGFSARWVAAQGDALDVTVPGLAIDATSPPTVDEVRRAVEGCALVVVENLLSLPLNPEALEVVAAALRGRPTIVHHHDLPWQRERFANHPAPPGDDAWAHVTINELSREQLAAHGIDATTIYNRFDLAPPHPAATLVVDATRPLLLHPTRAIARKNVPAAVRLAELLDGTYWLLGPAEDGYEDELDAIVRGARCAVRRGAAPIAEAYAACDLVVFPSTWEGFGNPTVESALARRPLAVGSYPVLEELRRFGFRWFDVADHEAVAKYLAAPDPDLIDHNERVAREHFSLAGLPSDLAPVLERVL